LGKVNFTRGSSPLAAPGLVASQSGVSPSRQRRVRPPAWSKWRWLTIVLVDVVGGERGRGARARLVHGGLDRAPVEAEDLGHLGIELVARAGLDEVPRGGVPSASTDSSRMQLCWSSMRLRSSGSANRVQTVGG
jgi:hypothetical protein